MRSHRREQDVRLDVTDLRALATDLEELFVLG